MAAKQNKYKKLGKNTVIMFVGTFVSKVLSFFMVPFYTSILTTEDYGISDLITTTVFLVLPFFSLLMDEALMRFTLDSAFDKKQVFTISVVISSIGYAILMCISPIIFFFDDLKPYYWLIVFYYVVSWTYNIVIAYVRGMDKLVFVTIAGIIHTFIFLSLNILLLAVLKEGIRGYLLAMIISNFSAELFLIISCKIYKNFISVKKIDISLAKSMILYSLPMIPNYILWWINNSLDRYMVSYFCGNSSMGIYSVAYKIPSVLSTVSSIFYTSWKISSVDDFGTQESTDFFNKIYKMYSGVLLISASGLVLITKALASVLYAKDFFIAWRITPLLVVAYTLSALANFVESIFNASKKTKKLFIASLIGAVVNTVLNFLLIPYLEGTGAAIATAISYAVILAFDMINTRKIIKMNFNLKILILSYGILILEIVAVLLDSIVGYAVAVICVAVVCLLNGKVLIQIMKMGYEKIKEKRLKA